MAEASAQNFVHLHVHSEFSLLDGLSKIPALVSRARELGMDAIALTDHGAMFGAVDFYLEAKKQGLKPIIGCEFYVAPRSRRDREPKLDSFSYHLTVLASDATGYRNLLQLATKAQLEGFYYRPRIDRELLAQHSQGLVCLSGCESGEVPRLVLDRNIAQAAEAARWYLDLFGRENYFIEIQNQGRPHQAELNRTLAGVAAEIGAGLAGTNDSHYLLESDRYAHEVLLCIGTNTTMNSPDRMRMEGSFHLRPPHEMIAAFAEHPEAALNTVAIAGRCNLTLDFGRISLPEIEIPPGHTAESHLRSLAEEGLAARLPDAEERYRARLETELRLIEKLGFAPYFLIHADIFRFARSRKMLAGPRGSVGGSLVAYALYISDIDPVVRDIPFERFLNEGRSGRPPDIDMDFPDDGREQVIRYVVEKFGRDRVAQIATFGTMAARQAIRDVGRALDMTYDAVDEVAKAIPFSAVDPFDIQRSLDSVPLLRERYDSDEAVRQLIDTAKQLEGVARNASVHAAGVIVSNVPVMEHVPLMRSGSTGEPVAQFTFGTLERIGFLKMDFLGLTTFRTITTALQFVREYRGLDLEPSAIPLDDGATFDLLSRGKTVGLFQLESSGMTRYIIELKPTSVADLAAMVSLYRPGPMKNIEAYITAKRDPSKVSYVHPRLESILAETHGVMVYQDQVLIAARDLAGFTWPEIEVMRKAMGKKIASELRVQRRKFIAGAGAGGIEKAAAEKIYDLIEPFGGYGFNKAHAYFYGTVAYWTAYLKANFPVEYMAAVLITHSDDAGKVSAAVAECREFEIEVVGPSVSRSSADFHIDGKAIVYGLGAVKNVGHGAIESVVSARSTGPFNSLENFCERVDSRALNRRALESLIKAGAMDELGERNALLSTLGPATERAGKLQREGLLGHATLFDALPVAASSSPSLPAVAPASVEQRRNWEVELLGFPFTSGGLEDAWSELRRLVSHSPGEIGEAQNGQTGMTTGGQIKDVRRFTTRKGSEMAAFVLVGPDASIPVTIFPGALARYSDLVVEGAMVLISGEVEADDREVRVLIGNGGAVRPFVPSTVGLPSPAGAGPEPQNYAARANGNDPSRMASNESSPAKPAPPVHAARAEAGAATGASAELRPGQQVVTVTLQRSGDPERDRELLAQLDKVANAHRGEAELRLVVSGQGFSTQLRWGTQVDPSQSLVKDLELHFGAGGVDVPLAPAGS